MLIRWSFGILFRRKKLRGFFIFLLPHSCPYHPVAKAQSLSIILLCQDSTWPRSQWWSRSSTEMIDTLCKQCKDLPPVWLQRVSWRGEMAAPLLSFPPPPCVYTSHLQPQDTCHLRHRNTGRWWWNIYAYTFFHGWYECLTSDCTLS